MATHSLDDLRRVIRRIETRRPKRPAPQPIEEVLGGELVDTGEGTLLVVRREFPLSHRHGRQTLGAVLEAPLDLLSTVARAEHPVEDARGLLFLDAEPVTVRASAVKSARISNFGSSIPRPPGRR